MINCVKQGDKIAFSWNNLSTGYVEKVQGRKRKKLILDRGNRGDISSVTILIIISF